MATTVFFIIIKGRPYPSLILAVLFKARHAVSAAKGMALAS
jgi:hypothetical protein